jgi:ketosteroid isomerase-like protein
MMKSLVGLVCVLFVGLIPVAAMAAEPSIPVAAKAEIDAANTASISALKTGDLDRAYEAFAPDSVFIGPGDTVTKGLDAAKAVLHQQMTAGFRIVDGRIVQLGAVQVGDSILEWRSFFLEIADPAGGRHMTAHYNVVVWVKAPGGRWVIDRSTELGGAPTPTP